jgi:hypothetical protein
MKNVYDGVVELDAQGQAIVPLPAWMESLNADFRYQLTPLGGPAPELHIAEEINHGSFRIAGGREGLRISWQVTGIRQDPWAQANPLRVETDKADESIGRYLHPEFYGESTDQSMIRDRLEWRIRRPEDRVRGQ